MTRLCTPRPGLLAQVTADTVVCRCESLTRAEVEAEIQDGASSPDAVKSGVRCGMGPCGGRFCAETAALLIAEATGKARAEVGLPTARPPLLPVPMSALAADFDYDDLPIPAPAPL